MFSSPHGRVTAESAQEENVYIYKNENVHIHRTEVKARGSGK